MYDVYTHVQWYFVHESCPNQIFPSHVTGTLSGFHPPPRTIPPLSAQRWPSATVPVRNRTCHYSSTQINTRLSSPAYGWLPSSGYRTVSWGSLGQKRPSQSRGREPRTYIQYMPRALCSAVPLERCLSEDDRGEPCVWPKSGADKGSLIGLRKETGGI